MTISNINLKSYATTMSKVSESLDSSKDREGGRNFYEQNEQEELPKDRKELFQYVNKELDELIKEDDFNEFKNDISYKVVEVDKEVFVEVINSIGERVRFMKPEEFLRVRKEKNKTKGRILNSVF